MLISVSRFKSTAMVTSVLDKFVDTVRFRQFNQFKGDTVNCSGSFSKSSDRSKLVT